ncbi:adenylate/guanylate cyclase domain-containing protein [Chachezhania sediminis]|uniref:adenylate/guanylate cyclase domain-containing protein n=1 Tax=Chachezhania sediminis TaxID=2599291 RepID=UPI00131DA94E|nr:adenylate/guanylate cyclase domain-containing protein [Chachezhania sediminis]
MTGAPDPIAPFPLRRRFVTWVVPGLVVMVIALLVVISQALSGTAERLYRQETAFKHRLLVAAMAGPDAPGSAPQRERLETEAGELGFNCAAIRSADDQLIVATSAAGCLQDRTELFETLGQTDMSAFTERVTDATQWVVASLVDRGAGALPLIVVTQQDARSLEGLIGATTKLWLAVIFLGLAAVLGVAMWLIGLAQTQIDNRTAALVLARQSLARFVSRHVQSSAGADDGAARRLPATVLFLDIRDFSGFADGARPEEITALVNRVAEVAFAQILAHGGDVDRLLGDGLIAWFEGEDRRDRAWRAVAAILPELDAAALPRGVGAGLHDGDVVEATLGAGERLDHTVLGGTVNIAARLCARAGAGRVIASDQMGPPPADVQAAIHGKEALTLKGVSRPMHAINVGFSRIV